MEKWERELEIDSKEQSMDRMKEILGVGKINKMDKLFTFSDFKRLYTLSRNRNASKCDYFHFQKFQGELLIRFLISNRVTIENSTVLDLGCGFGGYSSALKEAGANVIGLDLHPIKSQDKVPIILGDGQQLPFRDSSFDNVICASLIEHVSSPEALINETLRVLKTNGFIYISFPPFYSPVGGHQFSPYHLFGEKFAIYLSSKKKIYRESPWIENFSNKSEKKFSSAYGNWGLYPTKISQIRRIFSDLPVRSVKQATRYFAIDFSRIPFLGEFLTWHVQFLYQKI